MPAALWIVEDDASFRDAIAFVVGAMPELRCTRSFGDAEAALKALRAAPEAERPALVLLDVNLPGVDGVTAAAQFREAHPDGRVVMLTVRDDAETIYAALCAGASGYLIKDAPVDTLLAGLREALSGGVLMPAPVARRVLAYFQRPVSDYKLTPRELEVLAEMVRGHTQKEIAAALGISPSTVNGHVQQVYAKLHVRTAPAAVALAVRQRLV